MLRNDRYHAHWTDMEDIRGFMTGHCGRTATAAQPGIFVTGVGANRYGTLDDGARH